MRRFRARRWVLAFDDDFAARLARREAAAMSDWKRIGEMVGYLRAASRVARHARIRQAGRGAGSRPKGGLLSGGILDMIAVRHTPVRPIPRQQLTPEALKGAHDGGERGSRRR